MSKYTIEIRHLRNTNFPFDSFMGDYPIWDEGYRQVLNKKILDHFHFDEIAHETPDRWGFRVKTKLNEIMPYYNQLYKSTIFEFNPLYNIDLIETSKGLIKNDGISNQSIKSDAINNSNSTSEESSLTNGSTTSDSTNNNGETRVESVGNVVGGGPLTSTYLNSGDYADNMTITKAEPTTDTSNSNATNKVDTTAGSSTQQQSESNNTSNTTTTDESTQDSVIEKIIRGYNGSNPAYALQEFRKTLLNIDMMIIKELKPLFMTIIY